MELNKLIKIITMVILGHSVIIISGGIVGYAYGTYLNNNSSMRSIYYNDQYVCVGCRAASLLLLIYYLYLLLKKVDEQDREIRRLWVV